MTRQEKLIQEIQPLKNVSGRYTAGKKRMNLKALKRTYLAWLKSRFLFQVEMSQ